MTCILWWCRALLRIPPENVNELRKSDLGEKQKRSSISSDSIFVELPLNSSSSQSWVIPLEVLPYGKHSSSMEGSEDTGRAPDARYTIPQYGTDGSLTKNYSQPELSSTSAISYMDHIRAPLNVFPFYTELQNKHEPNENSLSEEYDYMNRGTRKTRQLGEETEIIEDGGVKLLLKSDVKEDSNYLSVRSFESSDDGHLSVWRSCTPRSSCSLIPLNDFYILNSSALLLMEGSHLLSVATPSELYGSKSWRPDRRPKWEEAESSDYIRSPDVRRASWSFDRRLHGYADPSTTLETTKSTPLSTPNSTQKTLRGLLWNPTIDTIY